MPQGRKFRWIVVISICVSLSLSIVFAIIVFYAEPPQRALQLAQKLFENIGTIAVAGLYLWREYLQRAGERARIDVQATSDLSGEAHAEALAMPQIIQNIFPPSTAPSALDPNEVERAVEALIARTGELKAGVVTVQRLVLTDEQGRKRLTIGIGQGNGPGIRIFDQSGCPRIVLGVGEGGQAALQFYDMHRRRRASLAVRADGFGELALLDAAGSISAALGSTGDDILSYFGLRGEAMYALVMNHGQISESVWDERARLVWSSPIRPAHGG